ncbi:optineurin isoform X2 [Hippocampus comes]|uniref:Optineurin n=2 Tax=Hippocampus comes TaxID=109280 RepID=A0A3Q3DCY8_HIPCM|nr:PREDICTED: optineurin isoform X2 [Hippocampus comes]
MSSEDPIMNGEISRSPSLVGTPEEALCQMNILIQENRNLKEALRQTNLTMKERFEELCTWREKQRDERVFLERRLGEARVKIEALAIENELMNEKLEAASKSNYALGVSKVADSSHIAEMDALRALVTRLQAEKNDLVALNSELQLKIEQNSPEDSFIQVITVSDEGSLSMKAAGETGKHPDVSMMASRLDNGDVTVSHLLQSLRNETQRAEQLQAELQSTIDMIKSMEEKRSHHVTVTTQTNMTEEPRDHSKTAQVASEFIKSQMMMLFKELQQAQSKLDDAEGMKKNLQDRCREVENDVATLKALLADSQAVKTENEQLKLQLDSLQAQNLMVQKKVGEGRTNLAQLKDAYTKLFEDYNELQEEKKRREAELVDKEVVDDLQGQLSIAEKALATKQERIDSLKQEIFKKEKELETISVLEAQAEVYCSDFYAERAAREKLHEERERLAVQLEYVKKQNNHLQEEMSRQKLGDMQRRHVANANAHGPALVSRGTDWQQQGSIPEHVCPKCNEILPDMDSLQIHIMDCIN